MNAIYFDILGKMAPTERTALGIIEEIFKYAQLAKPKALNKEESIVTGKQIGRAHV